MTTTEILTQRLELIYKWYTGMVNPHTGMLEYLYIPQEDTYLRENCPIRDIASIWDVEMLSAFLNKRQLLPLIEKSLRHFGAYLLERDGYRILDSCCLREPSSIAHSAFMTLAMLHAPPPGQSQLVVSLAEGILRQQRADGSYKVYFHDLPDEGEELYAGEAMLALLECYRRLLDARYVQSAERGFSFYDAKYFRYGRVREDVLVFFANWQTQACRLLFECAQHGELRREVADFVYRMHDRIIDRGFFEDIEQHPARQVSVEVACALEGINDAYALARASSDDRTERYRRCICVGLSYLLRLQVTDNGTERERGGFGLSLQERRQRIDITGHAASAFMKSVENKVECEPPAF